MMNIKKLKDSLHHLSCEMGFLAMGVTEATPLEEYHHLRQWLKNGYQADMAWLARDPESRCDPRSLWPGAKSVICLALAYGEGGISENARPAAENMNRARFARGLEYHKTVGEKLKSFWNKVVQFHPAARAKFCVDTSPILEKALAVKTGLGWQGKNSLVINPDKGSYFVLGEIITDLELEPDRPLDHSCGDCRECMKSCPTGAIVNPKVIDARRCLSYLTIEHKGPLTKDFIPHLKRDQYGCDICQEVCPYNARKS